MQEWAIRQIIEDDKEWQQDENAWYRNLIIFVFTTVILAVLIATFNSNWLFLPLLLDVIVGYFSMAMPKQRQRRREDEIRRHYIES